VVMLRGGSLDIIERNGTNDEYGHPVNLEGRDGR
jgi:hypothetical protein